LMPTPSDAWSGASARIRGSSSANPDLHGQQLVTSKLTGRLNETSNVIR
jgi:hypothetical protein